MIRFLIFEIKKCAVNRYFLIVVSILIVFSFIDVVQVYNEYIVFQKSYQAELNPAVESFSIYNSWLGGKNSGIIPTILYFLLPIYVALPFSWTYVEEYKSGYIKCAMILVKSRSKYYWGKYISVFMSGMIMILIPIITNLFMLGLFLKPYVPDIMWGLYYAVPEGMPFSKLFYTYPNIYLCVYIFIQSVFAGAWATMSLSISFYVKNKITAILASYICLLFLVYIIEKMLVFKVWVEISPMNFIRGVVINNNSNVFIIFGTIALLIIISSVLTCVEIRRKDDY